MRVLIVGTKSKLVINYLNYIVTKNMESREFMGMKLHRIEYICIDEDNLDKAVMLNEKIHTNFKFIKMKFKKQNLLDVIKNYNISHVINFHEVINTTIEEYTKNNFDFVIDLYDACVECNISHLTHISTTLVYGNSRQTFCNEKTHLKPTCDYTDSKINADLFLLSQNKIPTAILRIAEIFGPIYKETLLDKILVSVLEDKDVLIEEEEDFIRSYINVQDCVYFVNSASFNEIKGAYNVCSDLHISAKDMISKLADLFNYQDRVKYVKTKKVTLQYSKVEGSSISNILNYTLTRQVDKFAFFVNELKYEREIHRLARGKFK